MGNSKETNYGGKSFVVDTLTELYPRESSRISYLKSAIGTAQTDINATRDELRKNFSIRIEGSLELSPETEDDGKTIKGYTDLTAQVLYTRAGNAMIVTDIPDSAYTWYEVGGDSPLQSGGKGIRITKTGQFQCTVAYTYPISSVEPGYSSEIAISLTTVFTVGFGTIKLYTYSDSETREELLQSLDNLKWYPDPEDTDRTAMYLWRKESNDGGKAWRYFRDTGLKGDDGKAFNVVIESTNGNIFRPQSVSTTLNCRVYLNGEDVTDTLEASRFNWTRNTGNEELDESWGNLSKARSHKSIDITTDDCIGRTVFDCIVDIGE